MVLNLSSKKGQSFGYFELILVVALIFIVAVFWLVSNKVGSDINNYLLEDNVFANDTVAHSALVDLDERRTSFFNGAFAFLVFGLFLLGGISAWFSFNNPIFFVVTFILLALVFMIPILLGDSWEMLSEDFDGAELTFIDFILKNHLTFSIVFGFFVLTIMFVKARLDF